MEVAAFLHLSAALLFAAAVFGFINHRFFRLPNTIGIVLIALGASFLVLAFDGLTGAGMGDTLREGLRAIDFHDSLMIGMLSFLLFAGALHVDLSALWARRWAILALATFGVALSTVVVGTLTWVLLGLIGVSLPFMWCLVFGSLISPTDPVAVMGILKKVHVPPSLEAKIAGESLFNDGVGVVVFLVLLSVAVTGPENAAVGEVGLLFVQEVVGGLALGLVGGFAAYWALKQIDEHNLEVLITLALVTGLYSLALVLHASGPLAVVVAGLFIGNHGRRFAMSETTRVHVTSFWSLLDEILNSVLFLIIGLEVLVIGVAGSLWWAIAVAIPIVLVGRTLAVSVPMAALGMRREYTQGAVPVLIWGGLRGGISVALALSLPAIAAREPILVMTYGVVIFSIVVQGLTIERVIRRSVQTEESTDAQTDTGGGDDARHAHPAGGGP